jgi:hypothetical protein
MMHAAAGHALDDLLVGYVDLEHDGRGFTPAAFMASACGMVRGKPSNRNPWAQSGCLMRSFDQADDDVVTHESAGVHHLLGLDAQRRAGLDGCTQHVAGGDLGNAELLDR